MWWKKNKGRAMISLLIVAGLAVAFYFGGNAPGAKGWSVPPALTPVPSKEAMASTFNTSEVPQPDKLEPEDITDLSNTVKPAVGPTDKPADASTPALLPKPVPESPTPMIEVNSEPGGDQYLTDPIKEGEPLPVEPQDMVIGSAAYTCTLSISCAAMLDNIDLCEPEKVELVPEDGWILEPVVVTFYEGESVFNVLQRTCKQLGIHMEYANTPIYNSSFIKGIHNLYEFDAGELAGWMYEVNGWFPNYGCSRYQLKDGDVIDWVYTCDQGYDVGGYAGGGNGA